MSGSIYKSGDPEPDSKHIISINNQNFGDNFNTSFLILFIGTNQKPSTKVSN
jgi:hypothetical protein